MLALCLFVVLASACTRTSEVQIEQVIVNLVQNAIEARPASDRVEVFARREGRGAFTTFRVSSRFTGLPESADYVGRPVGSVQASRRA